MPKTNTIFFCQECGNEFAKWMGQCPVCKSWNTMVEAPKPTEIKANVRTINSITKSDNMPVFMDDIVTDDSDRIETGISEFDRVLGGGIVKGSLILIGGDPGIGKSTLLTQVCKEISDKNISVLYISGEESLAQIKLRANRLGKFTKSLSLLCETDLNRIENIVSELKPDVCIIDSIQTVYRPDIQGTPGSISQVKESTGLLLQLAKGLGIATFVVGHVTKDGTVAGPRMLEHMVDTVLYFEGEKTGAYRILRSVKNRFGSTNEIGVFEMSQTGLKEIKNPSEYMLNDRPENATGSVVSCTIEGTRPILEEIQVLATKSVLANPRRSAVGIDYNRVNLLIAVIEKQLNLQLYTSDIYVNLVGGGRITETAFDLAIISAIVSSYMNIIIPSDTLIMGEVGLSGEIRGISQIETRIKEAERLGFKNCIIPASMCKNLNIKGINIIGISNIKEVLTEMKKIC